MQDERKKIDIDAFGIVHDRDFSCPVDASEHLIPEWGLELDKTTGYAKPVITGQFDMYESIQSFKDSCGIEAVKRDIACGRVTPEDIADDGKHGGDFTNPTMISEMTSIVRQAIADSKAADEEAAKKGLDVKAIKVDGLDLDAYIKQQVEARLPQKEGDSK